MEYYSAIKKNEIMPLAATRMDLEIIIRSKVSQTEKDKYMLTSFQNSNDGMFKHTESREAYILGF